MMVMITFLSFSPLRSRGVPRKEVVHQWSTKL